MKTKLVVASAFCLGTSCLCAQDFAKDTLKLDEVVITSRFKSPTEVSKLPVPLSKAPLSVSKVSTPMITDLSLNSLIDVARNVTGVRPTNTYGGFQTFNIPRIQCFCSGDGWYS